MESLMVVPYQWILGNIQREPRTLSSEMILFRGEKVFRVSLKNVDVSFPDSSRRSSPTLFLIAINLQKLGMRVREVIFVSSKCNNQLVTMTSTKTNDYRDGNLQLFKADIENMILGNCTFTFRIVIEGSVPGYSYKCSDQLLSSQLWEGVTKMKNFTDFALIVKDKKYSVHKAILASRSPVFEAKFEKENNISQSTIDDVEPFVVEQFLYFLYTGKACKLLANKQLLKLAILYQLKTLENLCQSALIKINVEQTARCLTDQRQDDHPILSPLVIGPMKDTEIYCDPSMFALLFDWNLNMPAPNERTNTIASPAFEYQNEKLFSARIEGYWCDQRNFSSKHPMSDAFVGLQSSTIRLVCSNHRSIGCTVKTEVFCSLTCDQQPEKYTQRIQMKREETINQDLILVFWAPIKANFKCSNSYTINFWITMASIIDNYYPELTDTSWPMQLGSAAEQRRLTDIEISVGQNKNLFAHRCVLSARSPVLATLLADVNKTTIMIDKRFDFGIVSRFFEFLYTGILTIPADDKQLLELAETYQVETLTKICKTANNVPNVDDITKSLLAVI